MGVLRTLGLDPGTARMGWGVVEETNGTLRSLGYGVLTTPADYEPARRLLLLHQALAALLREYGPDAAAVEELFFSRNVTTALGVGQARGVALLTFAQAGIPVFEYKPREVKQAVAGYGAADKQQIQEMVRMTLQLKTRPRPDDAADALAIAICHAYTAPVLQRIAQP